MKIQLSSLRFITFLFYVTVSFLTTPLFSQSVDDPWIILHNQNEYDALLVRAHDENKSVLLLFEGSNWCHFCIQLNKEVFSQDAFKEYAAKKLLVVKVDFPAEDENTPVEEKQPQDVINENYLLASKYNLNGVPALVLLNPNGNMYRFNSGYFSGGAQGFINWAEGTFAPAAPANN